MEQDILNKTDQIIEALDGCLTTGIREAGENKIRDYVNRILLGEQSSQLLSGLPTAWAEEVNKRVKTIKDQIVNPDVIWIKLHPDSLKDNPAEKKIFYYACDVLRGEKFETVTIGLQDSWKKGIIETIAKIISLTPLNQNK